MRSVAGTTFIGNSIPTSAGRRSGPLGPQPLLNGSWRGTIDGYTISLDISEHTSFAGSFVAECQALYGRGSMWRNAQRTDELSLPFTVVGIHQAGNTGIWIHLEFPVAAGRNKWFGHFMGQLDGSGALTGQFYSTGENATGPLVTPEFQLRPIKFERS